MRVTFVTARDSGGNGRVQAVLAVVGHLQMGRRPAILFGGSGGLVSGPGAVDPQKNTVTDCGAEAPRGFGNGLPRPAGPLGEPLTRGLGRADLVLSVGSEAAQASFEQICGERISCQTIRGRLAPVQTGMTWQGARLLAFAGSGPSQMFFTGLRGLGANLVRCVALEDHHPLGAALMTRLEREAASLGAQLVTTETDALRLTPPFRRKVLILPLRLQVDDWAAFDVALARIGLARG